MTIFDVSTHSLKDDMGICEIAEIINQISPQLLM